MPLRYDCPVSDRESTSRGKSRGQARRRAIEALRARHDFLRGRIDKAEAEGRSLSFDAREASALAWALERLAPMESRSALTDPPPLGVPVTLNCDAGTVIGVRSGAEYLCSCGNPDPLTGVTAWDPAPPAPDAAD